MSQKIESDTSKEGMEEQKVSEKLHDGWTPNKNILEGLYWGMFSDIKLALDTYGETCEDKGAIDNFKACYYVTRSAVIEVLEFLEPMKDAQMNIKHRCLRELCKEFDKRMELAKVWEAKNRSNKHCIRFGMDLVQFLEVGHIVFHEDTPHKQRRELVEIFQTGGGLVPNDNGTHTYIRYKATKAYEKTIEAQKKWWDTKGRKEAIAHVKKFGHAEGTNG